MLRNERTQEVQRLNLLMIVPSSYFLRRLHGFLGLQCEFVEAHHLCLPLIPK
jgi:hypothetical protein